MNIVDDIVMAQCQNICHAICFLRSLQVIYQLGKKIYNSVEHWTQGKHAEINMKHSFTFNDTRK